MPGKGNRNRRGGRGGSRGRGGVRGRGRGGFRGGGRGRNRNLFETSIGYVYQLESNVDQYDDDFRIYGQFSSDDEDSEHELYNRKNGRRSNFMLEKQSRLPLESSYNQNGQPSSSITTATHNRSSGQFAKGKSKYLKTVLFTKSSSDLRLNDKNEGEADNEGDKLTAPLSQMSLSETKTDKPIETLWSSKKLNSQSYNIITEEIVDFADFNNDEDRRGLDSFDDSFESPQLNETVADVYIKRKVVADNCRIADAYNEHLPSEEELEPFDLEESTDEELSDLDDIIEEMILKEEGIFEELVTSEDEDEEKYDYATLDCAASEDDTLSEEEKNITSSSYVNENLRKKKIHRTVDHHAIVDPEIFGQDLRTALADVPVDLKPGMRRWHERQQRKERRKKKKEEAKLLLKEKRNKKKGKMKFQEEEVSSSQLSKIDERIRDFILDSSINSYQFAPMGAHLRRQIHIMAAFYNLKSKSGGFGDSRYTVITRTNETYIPTDRRSMERFLLNSQHNIDEQNRIINKNRKKFTSSSGSSTPKTKTKSKPILNKSIPTPGTIVAYDAPPINEENVGHRMLAAMGWKQGDALGSKNSGITVPVEAVIRKKNQGLGS